MLTSTVLRIQSSSMRIVLVPIDELKPHERGSPLYLELLRKEILRDGVLKYPIITDEKTHVILDGMHRWLVLKNLGYKSIPAMLVDAFQNPAIRIGKRRIHQYSNDPSEMISIDRVISAGLNGHLMQPRTTRHFFPFPKYQLINYPLQLLKKGTPCDVSEYLSEMNAAECSQAIKQWLDEISEELEFLANKRVEVEKEKQEFLNRVKNSANGFSSY